MARCLIALGSNLGDRADYLRRALREVAGLVHVRLLLRSRWHETVPIGGAPGQRSYLNGALLLETQLSASQLLERLLGIESRLGRQRGVSSHGEDSTAGAGLISGGAGLNDGTGLNDGRWSPRTVDLDLLLYGVECRESRTLQLPHPRMSYRRFVLEPAVEIAGWMPHPTSGSVLARLLWQLNKAGDYVVIMATGSQASASQSAEWLTHELALTIGCRWWKHEGPIGPYRAPEGTRIHGLLPCRSLRACGRLLVRERVQACAADGGKLAGKFNPQSLQCDVSVNIGSVDKEGGGLGERGRIGGGCEFGAGSQGNLEFLPAHPKLVIVWEKRTIKDRMEEMERAIREKDRFRGKSGEATRVQNTRVRGPMASIITTDSRQALAEALAAIQSIWPAAIPQA